MFLNRIRLGQPDRQILTGYFDGRHWKGETLQTCVVRGMKLAEEAKEPFNWLTVTNAGASEVCEAALDSLGISKADLASGYAPDPNTKSPLRILARRGLLLRLSRNFDKQRGFVTGALVYVEESLRGNAVFTARLVGSGNMVLVHPMEEEGQKFLPCCYGYATTIRRAQGASFYHGCIYMNHRKPCGRGYGYVAVSRFKSRRGTYLYGRLRRTDFLPVGGEGNKGEVLDREFESLSSDDEDGPGPGYAFDSSEDEEEGGQFAFPEGISNDFA